MRCPTFVVLLSIGLCLVGATTGGVAQTADTRTPEAQTVAPGETVEVTVTVSAPNASINLVDEAVTRGDAYATITEASSEQSQALTEENSVSVVYLTPVAEDTLTYTVAIADTTASGTEIRLSGTIVDGDGTETDTGTTTLTVEADDDGSDGSDGDSGDDDTSNTDDSDGGDNTDDSDGSDNGDTGGDAGIAPTDGGDGSTGSSGGSNDPPPETDSTPANGADGDASASTSGSAPGGGPTPSGPTPATPTQPEYVPGETVTVTFTLRNSGGQATAANVTVTDVPAGLALVDGPTRSLNDRLEPLNDGTAVEVPYDVRIEPTAAPGSYELAATLTLVSADGTTHTATTTVTVPVSEGTPMAPATDRGGAPVRLMGVGLILLLAVGWWGYHQRF
jgi:uncharacterized repeat protein (TIGR01451 family)